LPSEKLTLRRWTFEPGVSVALSRKPTPGDRFLSTETGVRHGRRPPVEATRVRCCVAGKGVEATAGSGAELWCCRGGGRAFGGGESESDSDDDEEGNWNDLSEAATSSMSKPSPPAFELIDRLRSKLRGRLRLLLASRVKGRDGPASSTGGVVDDARSCSIRLPPAAGARPLVVVLLKSLNGSSSSLARPLLPKLPTRACPPGRALTHLDRSRSNSSLPTRSGSELGSYGMLVSLVAVDPVERPTGGPTCFV
jgi:hypothetical protein